MIVSWRYGDIDVPEKEDLIVTSLRTYGEWAQVEIEMLSHFIKNGDVVVDAGAFIGTHARAFSSMVGLEGRVHAFEPNPIIFSSLEKNASISEAQNITVYQKGLGKKKEKRVLVNTQVKGNEGATHLGSFRGKSTEKNVAVVTLDLFNLDTVNFIKLDVEGMEFDILLGGERTITASMPVVFMEVNSLDASYRVLDWSKERGYCLFGLISPAYNANNYNNETDNIFGQSRECGFLLMHSEKVSDFSSAIEKLQLFEIKTLDDVVLLLLHKPQYEEEVLQKTTSVRSLGIDYTTLQFLDLERKYRDVLNELNISPDERNQQVIKLNERKISWENLKIIASNLDEENLYLKRAMEQQEGRFDSFEKQMSEKNELLSELQDEAKVNMALISKMKNEVWNKDSTLKDLNQVLDTVKDQASDLNATLLEKEGEIDRLRQIVFEYQEKAEGSGLKIEALEDLAKENLREIIRRDVQISNLENLVEEHRNETYQFKLSASGRVKPAAMLLSPLIWVHSKIPGKDQAIARVSDLRVTMQNVLNNKIRKNIYWQKGVIKDYFDHNFYCDSYPEITGAIDPMVHYLRSGWKEGKNPSPYFNTDYYLTNNSDVTESKINPLLHYLVWGGAEARLCSPIPKENLHAFQTLNLNEDEVLSAIEELTCNERHTFDVLKENTCWDYVSQGLSDGHKSAVSLRYLKDCFYIRPTVNFDAEYYLSEYQDIANAGTHPFYHYCVAGKAEGRRQKRISNPFIESIMGAVTVPEKTKGWVGKYASLKPLSMPDLVILLSSRVKDDLIISLSHDNSLENVGGVQSCVQREMLLSEERGLPYLNLFPVSAEFKFTKNPLVAASMDGRFQGVIDVSLLIEYLLDGGKRNFTITVIAHTLQGHNGGLVLKLFEMAQRSVVWFHDYFPVCEGFTLLRNDSRYCGAPSQTSTACAICNNGVRRDVHLTTSRRIISKADSVLFPSKVALDIAEKTFPEIGAKSRVVPHVELGGSHNSMIKRRKPLRVAFLGYGSFHKGFHLFESVVDEFQSDRQIDFFQFSDAVSSSDSICNIPVTVSKDNPDAMVKAIRKEAMDIVLILSIWPETFNLTMYEALIAGTVVWTIQTSGNPASVVEQKGYGRCFETVKELSHALRNYMLAGRVERVNIEQSVSMSELSFSAITVMN